MAILIISGTNRPGSNALRVSRYLKSVYEAQQTPCEIYSLTELPPEAFAPETYAQKPASILQMQQRVLDASGLHVVTPEYNGSFPGVLKYWIDLLKFPESFENKPVAFVGEAAGQWGALRSVEQLQLIFGYRNAHIFPARVFIPAVHQQLDADGKPTDESIRKKIDQQCEGFARFIDSIKSQISAG